MKVTYLGHAGFLVETPLCLFLMDPWLSSRGAYNAAWFQFPCNHHIEQPLLERLRNSHKSLYVYISHEHQDHYDLDFLRQILPFKPIFVLPNFSTKAFEFITDNIPSNKVFFLNDQQILEQKDFSITIFLEESGVNRDSAILFQFQELSFLNLNDCKIFDRIHHYSNQQIDIFTTQFSGATWHPICYEYGQESYQYISSNKRLRKFKNVARALEVLQPKIFIPAAGPCCFLDEDLFHLNFEDNSIFPTAEEFLDWLDKNTLLDKTRNFHLLPGDSLTLPNFQLQVTEQLFEYQNRSKQEYLLDYKNEVNKAIEFLYKKYGNTNPISVFKVLGLELKSKCKAVGKITTESRCLYFGLKEIPNLFWKINLFHQTVEKTNEIQEKEFYSIIAPAWQVERILNHEIHWEDFCLTFRARLQRVPDNYSIIWNLFLFRNSSELTWAAKSLKMLEQKNNARIYIACPNTGKQWEINRYCPHQGADLSNSCVEEGQYLICPRHSWKFDLEQEGKLTPNGNFSVNSKSITN